MTIIRTPSPSVFRPKRRIDQAILTRAQGLDRDNRPPQRAARRAQSRRAVVADRLRRHRNRSGAERAARGFGVERPRSGIHL